MDNLAQVLVGCLIGILVGLGLTGMVLMLCTLIRDLWRNLKNG